MKPQTGNELANRWFGTGHGGFRRLFEVWGEDEPKNVANVPLLRGHAGTVPAFNRDSQLTARLAQNLAGPERVRRAVDPRILGATQYGVTWSGVNYYLNQMKYGQIGWTWADQKDPANREPVVWMSPDQGPVILSGHHRTVTALLLGRPVEVLWIELDELAVVPGIRISPLIWVGDCPYSHARVTGADEAEVLVRTGERCVVPNLEEAEQVLRQLGAEPAWIRSALAFARMGRI